MTTAPLDTFAAALSVPRFDNPACVGAHAVFDAAVKDPQARADALALCSSCPVRQPCADWLDTLPEDMRPAGVRGGKVIEETRRAAGRADTKRRSAGTAA